MGIIISEKIKEKLREKHNVSVDEVQQCFASRTAGFLYDNREDHQTDPPTLWFISETFWGRKLKVIFVMQDKQIFLKTCYEANPEEISIYSRKSVPLKFPT